MNKNEILLALFSVVMLTFGLLTIERNKRLQRIGKKATAVIFKNNYKRSRKGAGTYAPVVRFVTQRGEWITQELNFSKNPAMQEGREIVVIYDPENPKDVIMDSYWRIVLFPGLITLIGISLFALVCLELLDVTNYI